MINDPLKDTPSEITASLLRWGGKNPFGDPNWRIILAQNHLVQRSGMWTDFAEDTEQTHFETVGHHVRYQQREIAPDAIHVGTFWIPKYQCEGWILERWFPASSYGSREQWESARSSNGDLMMGPFPERGDYFMLSGGGPWPEIPNLEDVRRAIADWENSSHLHGYMDAAAVERAVRHAMEEEEEREQRKHDEFMEEVRYQRLTHLGFIKANPALSGYRNRLTRANGLMSHY